MFIDNKYKLKTGDILLFDNKGGGIMGIFSTLIKKITKSDISHVAMVLKDPYFVNPPLKGIYVWESNYEGTPDPQDGKIKFGVQITPLEEILDSYRKNKSKVFVRRIICYPSIFSKNNLEDIHKVVYDKVYDITISDWIEGIERKDKKPQKTDRFWCSALVGYIYTKCGLLSPTTDWSILRPSDFTTKYSSNLEFMNNACLDNEYQLHI
jgi:hypothetical protein